VISLQRIDAEPSAMRELKSDDIAGRNARPHPEKCGDLCGVEFGELRSFVGRDA
jgi:hypothetical protein